jgi:calcium-translocating P-type ATPase
VLATLTTSSEGLTPAEAARRLAEFGPNKVERVAPERWLPRVAAHFTHFFALILWLAAALALLAEQRAPGQGMLALGLAIVGVIVVNGLFSNWQEFRAQRMLAALQRLLPHEVKVLRGGVVQPQPAAQLVPGDVIHLQGGDDGPADCRLIEAFGVRVNIATITGEALPQARHAQPSPEERLIDARNVLLAGTSLVAGEAKAVVFATGMQTEFGRIANLAQAIGKTASPLREEIVRLSRWVAVLALALGVGFFFIGQAMGMPFWHNVLFAIGIIVANVPEGLLPTLTLALAMGSQRMARRNALIRHLPSVETLGSATVICTDKTGTLTLNRMRVRGVFLDGRWHADENGEARAVAAAHRPFIEAAALCHTLKPAGGNARWIGDPLEIALVELAHRLSQSSPQHARVDEIPFDSDRRRMSALHATPEGLVLYTKGALESVLPLCKSVAVGGGSEELSDASRARLLAAQDEMARQGLRVLALASRRVAEHDDVQDLEGGLTLLGLAALEDPPRAEVPGAIAQCRAAGIRVVMITGDHPRTAAAVARGIGLVQSDAPVIVTGDALSRLSDTQLQLALAAPDILFARVAADQKRRIVNALKRKGEIVAVTGDGVNDAPALREAHIGIAMGISGTDVAREAADMVLLDDNFASIVMAIEEGRAVFDNIRKFMTYILTSNIPELVPYLAFVLFRIPLPLTIIQILAVDLGTDMLPALALGAERPDPGVMRRPPRRRSDRLVDFALIARAYLFLGLLESAAAMATFFFVLWQGGWQYGEALGFADPLYQAATTACLGAIVAMQIANVYLCRSERSSILIHGMAGNPLILLGIGVEIALMAFIAYCPWGQAVFGTAPLPAEAWLFMLPFAAAMIVLEELRKGWARRRLLGGVARDWSNT